MGEETFYEWKERDKKSGADPIGWKDAKADVLKAEREEMARRRGVYPDKTPVAGDVAGLAISGGGIRSATFALGVLQALGERGLLQRFDYLSTVSGGGYLGASLSWLLRDQFAHKRPDEIPELGLERGSFPYGTADPDSDAADRPGWQKKLLAYLRAHGEYLTPGQRITLLSGLGVVLRGIIVNLTVWLPILAAVFVVFLVFDRSFEDGALVWTKDPADPLRMARWLVGLLIFIFACLSLGFAVTTYWVRNLPPWFRYWYRRLFEKFSGVLLKAVLALLVLASLPFVVGLIDKYATAAGVISFLLGSLSAIPTFKGGDDGESGIPLGVIAGVGAALLLYGVLILAYQLASLWFGGSVVEVYPLQIPGMLVVGAAVAVAVLVGLLSNLNLVGMRRFYRDRLMETFMPEPADALKNKTGPSLAADVLRLSDLAAIKETDRGSEEREPCRGPYHLINTNVVLVDSPRRKFQIRGGDSFLLAPRYCGSDATGYRQTGEFARDNITLASAMAISGAAAHPNTGVGGVGPMRQKAVAVLMNLLNIRLGYWIPHPSRPNQKARTPSHFKAAYYQVASDGYMERRGHLEISDGGHFENLGVYELVRRKCGFILAIDGAADPGFAFADLRNAGERIREDFGARLNFDEGEIEEMVPKEGDREDAIARAKCAKQGFAEGLIRYNDGTKGRIVYVKSTFVKELALRVRGYKRANKEFPDESTADQFFDESQFEAYRWLGYAIGEQAADPVDDRLPHKWW
ncbi:MAG: hypothetical protein GY937_02360 [bacterium]|nr:hypothetical protein [bacterium]